MRRFLESLGLTQPDPVDDVIRNILPAYQGSEVDLASYAADIDRILKASRTDSAAQREKLLKPSAPQASWSPPTPKQRNAG